jgi:Nucleotide-diphospho-sugar transferase
MTRNPVRFWCWSHSTDRFFLFIAIILPLVANVFGQKLQDRYLDLEHIRGLIRKSHNETREALVKATLASAAGVYRDKERGRALGIEKTVFLTVAAYNSKENIFHYKIYFRNFLCFAQFYDIDLVVYILHHNLPDVEHEVASLKRLGVKVLTYPDELFWTLVSQKTSKVMAGKTFADYSGDVPSFKSHGALAMLVPQLEALQLGYDVIYFDVDIGLVQDPVPYITRGDADFVVSIEQRACPEEYPTSRKFHTDWEGMEPNTGTMMVRATEQGIAMYRNWLKRIVKTNVMNDQIVFDRDHRKVQVDVDDRGRWSYSETNFTSTFTPNCNWDYQNKTPTARATPHAATYCFLSEMMFQNGMISFQCSRKALTRDIWHIEMVKQVPEIRINGTGQPVRLPVAVHANYCNGKSHELGIRGLWLFDEALAQRQDKENATFRGTGPGSLGIGCKAYNASNVYFAHRKWNDDLYSIEQHRLGILKDVMKNGSLVKRFDGDEVYIIMYNDSQTGHSGIGIGSGAASSASNASASSLNVDVALPPGTLAGLTKRPDGSWSSIYDTSSYVSSSSELSVVSALFGGLVRRLIPDGDTFLGMGFDWDKTHVAGIPSPVLFLIPEGPPFKSTSKRPKKPAKKKPVSPFGER